VASINRLMVIEGVQDNTATLDDNYIFSMSSFSRVLCCLIVLPLAILSWFLLIVRVHLIMMIKVYVSDCNLLSHSVFDVYIWFWWLDVDRDVVILSGVLVVRINGHVWF
ncbi:hypothetical protein ACJX0J_015313, partial [Zea mays]